MTALNLIKDKEAFDKDAGGFLQALYGNKIGTEIGEINIRIFPPGGARNYFCGTTSEAVNQAYDLCQAGIDTYMGVNPRVGKGGKKENIQFLTAFHAEVDYGTTGHKKTPLHETYDDALLAITNFERKPSIVNPSGGGFHCYWVLNTPIKVENNLATLEAINKNISLQIGGDTGTQDISRVLRIPGTFNLKDLTNPRKVTCLYNDGPKYDFADFSDYATVIEVAKPVKVVATTSNQENMGVNFQVNPTNTVDINSLPVSDRIKFLIQNGNDGSYPSRSEVDMAVVTVLVNKCVPDAAIKHIFTMYPIGEKYRGHNAPDNYLRHTIESAKERSNLTEEEMINPLFISGAIIKNDKKCEMDIVKFQEYLSRKRNIMYFENDGSLFIYNSKCYEICPRNKLNNICQNELGAYRKLFTEPSLNAFRHHCIGDKIVGSQHGKADQLKYFTMNNGLFNVTDKELIAHTPDIFTNNLLPYDYDHKAKCPRFIEFLSEVFENDTEIIQFIQEAIGYGFHKEINTPAIFFLIGNGSNGKSVLIDTITSLYGAENTCTVSLNKFTNEYYLLELQEKLINISSETPNKTLGNSDIIKAVVAGDWVTGREPYTKPVQFKPYAKHFFAMNEAPCLDDNSHGMWRRVYPIVFPHTFTEIDKDVHLTAKLAKELPGIFNWALDGYYRLKEQNFEFSKARSMKVSKDSYKSESDSVYAFTKAMFGPMEKNTVRFSTVYQQYERFCFENGHSDHVKKSEFKKKLQTAGYTVETNTKDSNNVNVFNVKLNS